MPAPQFYSVRECFNAFLSAISVVFLCLLAPRIAKRLTGDALVGQRRLLIDYVRLDAGWRHAVSLGRWLWRSRMARHVCRDEGLGFDAPQCVNPIAKAGVEERSVNTKIFTRKNVQAGELRNPWTSVPRQALAFDQ